MISYLQAIILGLLQGAAELFPVSGLGHSILAADLFGWHNVLQAAATRGPAFPAFMSIWQLVVALVLFGFYRSRWQRLLRSLKAPAGNTISGDARLIRLLILAFIPAAILTLLLQTALRVHFATSFFAMAFIVINGILLIRGDRQQSIVPAGQRPRQRLAAGSQQELTAGRTSRQISDHIDNRSALIIGVLQTAGLVAGWSRTGLTMLAGLRRGLSHQDAARFGFLLLAPVLLIAGLINLPAFWSPQVAALRGPALAGGLAAGIVAWLAVRFLDASFARRPSVRPYGIYCIVLAAVTLVVSIIRGAP